MATEDPFVCIAPAVTHTESVGADDAVFEKGCFDNLSNGKVNVSLDSLGSVSERSNPTQFLYASGKRQLAIKPGTVLRKANGTTFSVPAVITIADALVAGTDYYVYLNNDNTVTVSPTKTTDGTTALIGGFHALCANVEVGLTYKKSESDATMYPHPLSGYSAGDILPESVWCLNHLPYSAPEGMVFVDSLGFWCDIYLASGIGENIKSVYQGSISRSRTINDFIEDFFLVRKELLSDAEFSAAMIGSNEQTSVAGASEAGATTGGAGGRSDTAVRRMISIHGVEEGCGSVWQFLNEITMNNITQQSWVASGTKGSQYQCGAVIAGGDWTYGALCGSRSRSAYDARSVAHAYVGARGRSRHVGS